MSLPPLPKQSKKQEKGGPTRTTFVLHDTKIISTSLLLLLLPGLAFQQLLLLEVVSEQLSSLPDGDFYGNLARWVFMSASTLVIGYLASTNSAQHALFIPATSFIGAYLICLAFNHVWLLTEGELFTPLFEIDALLKSRGDEVLKTLFVQYPPMNMYERRKYQYTGSTCWSTSTM